MNILCHISNEKLEKLHIPTLQIVYSKFQYERLGTITLSCNHVVKKCSKIYQIRYDI